MSTPLWNSQLQAATDSRIDKRREDRLADRVDHAAGQAGVAIVLPGVGGHRQDKEVLGACNGTKTTRGFETVHHRRSGERMEVPVIRRLDTAKEISIYDAGGVPQRFAHDLLAATSRTAAS